MKPENLQKLENLVKIDKLGKEPTDRDEIGRYLGKINQRITDAAKRSVGLDSTFDIAYEGVLQIAIVALRAEGFRVRATSGHQQIAIQSLPLTLELAADETYVFDVFRRQRSQSIYGAEHDPTEAEVAALVEAAQKLQAQLLVWLAGQHPELL